MEKMSRMQSFLVLAVQLFLLIDCSMQKRDVIGNIKVSESNSPSGLQLNTEDKYVVMDNSLLQVTLSNPGGMVTAITYNGIDNVLERHNKEDGRGYWDVVWHAPGYDGHFDVIEGTSFKVIRADNNQIEVSFTRSYNSSHGGSYIPLNIDKRFIMLPNSSGFYTYAIYEHLEGMPSFILGENRIAFKLRNDKFHYMALSDTRQRFMPESKDRENGQQLAYPEAVLLTDPSNSDLKGQVDDKYQFSCDNKDNTVHGWISFDPPTGFWMITPSDEFRIGGPLKQDLTSHVGPTTLNMFHSSHYSGIDLDMDVQDGEPWKKVYGPIFIYLNSVSKDEDPRTLWNDAKEQMLTEVKSWPYSFPASKDFPSLDKRGTVTGRLQIQDRYINQELIAADSAYVGLAAPGDVGSWQRESKGYQFWTRADSNGSFSINGVRAGEYNLYAWVPGFIGDYKYDVNITITPGSQVSLGDLVYAPPRDGPTLWEIGVPDRSAAEFFVPDPDPNYATKLYTNSGNVSTSVDKFRQYGLWFRYADLYPNEDLVYTVGASDYKKDWFFAHVTRNIGNNTFVSTTWQIRFKLDNVIPHTTYKVRLAIASATFSDVELRFNNPNVYRSHFTTHMIGKDNSIARHGIHGLYWLFSVDVRSDWLVTGSNTLYLTQSRHTGPFQGVMYDYIRLEGPSTSG